MFAFSRPHFNNNNQVMSNSSIANVVSLDLETSWGAKNLQEALRQTNADASFQQKQMQEKEEKLLRLYENQQQRAIERVNRGSAGSNTSITSVTSVSTSQGGKVRQMFDERRQKAGIDRSYPLEPLRNGKPNSYANNGLNKIKNETNNFSKTVVKTAVNRSVTHVKNNKPLIRKRQVVESTYNNNNGDESYEQNIYIDNNDNAPTLNRTYVRRDLETMMNNHHINENIDDEEFPDVDIDEFDEPSIKSKLVNVEKVSIQNDYSLEKNTEQKQLKKTFEPTSESKFQNQIKKIAPKPARSSLVGGSPLHSNSSKKTNSNASPTNSPKRVVNKLSSVMSTAKSSNSQKLERPVSKQSARPSIITRDDLAACKYCARRFASDRLVVHEDICARTAKKKRKEYDATKHRVQGTELEAYTKKPNRAASVKSKQPPQKKSDWRRKHEEFIGAIRAAKQVQTHVAKGGKLSDLPPPPPSSNPDYVQCPHCGRRFNENAAERHVPKCATYEFNKPKQQARPGNSNSRNSSIKSPSYR